MKKKFVKRTRAAMAESYKAALRPTTVRSYDDFLFCALPGDRIWLRDLRAIDLDVCHCAWPCVGSRVRLTGRYVDNGQPVDMLLDGGTKCTIEGKATCTVMVGEREHSARQWSSFRREAGELNQDCLMVVNDNEKNSRQLCLGTHVPLVRVL